MTTRRPIKLASPPSSLEMRDASSSPGAGAGAQAGPGTLWFASDLGGDRGGACAMAPRLRAAPEVGALRVPPGKTLWSLALARRRVLGGHGWFAFLPRVFSRPGFWEIY